MTAFGATVLAFALAAAPDSILFRGAESPVSGTVLESGRDAVVVRVARSDVESAERVEDAAWPDRVKLAAMSEPAAAAVVAEDALSLTIRFPSAAIVRIEREAVETPAALMAGASATAPEEGSIAGRVVRKGAPIARCRVRAIRLVEEKDVLGLTSRLRPVRTESPPEASTCEDGNFRIDGLEPGLYKLYLCPEGEETWIRRLREAPDAVVKKGFVARLKDVDLSRRPL